MFDVSLFLSTGVITKILELSRIVDVEISKLKMWDNGLINECIFNLNIFTVIPSNPPKEKLSLGPIFYNFFITYKLNLLNKTSVVFNANCLITVLFILCIVCLMFYAAFVKYLLKQFNTSFDLFEVCSFSSNLLLIIWIGEFVLERLIVFLLDFTFNLREFEAFFSSDLISFIVLVNMFLYLR